MCNATGKACNPAAGRVITFVAHVNTQKPTDIPPTQPTMHPASWTQDDVEVLRKDEDHQSSVLPDSTAGVTNSDME